MDKIENVKIIDCNNSMYIKPRRMEYEQDGKKKIWDLMRIHDSVDIVIFNKSKQTLVFVKQFRPAAYYKAVELEDCEGDIDIKKYPPSIGMTIELCSGIVDKDQSLVETARDEVMEECGYSAPLTSFRKVTSYRTGVGVTGSVETLYYVEVTDSMKVSKGGGIESEGEYIDVVELSLSEAKSLIYDESVPRPGSLILALLWFFENQRKANL